MQRSEFLFHPFFRGWPVQLTIDFADVTSGDGKAEFDPGNAGNGTYIALYHNIRMTIAFLFPTLAGGFVHVRLQSEHGGRPRRGARECKATAERFPTPAPPVPAPAALAAPSAPHAPSSSTHLRQGIPILCSEDSICHNLLFRTAFTIATHSQLAGVSCRAGGPAAGRHQREARVRALRRTRPVPPPLTAYPFRVTIRVNIPVTIRVTIRLNFRTTVRVLQSPKGIPSECQSISPRRMASGSLSDGVAPA
jgi:hypothetical protein